GISEPINGHCIRAELRLSRAPSSVEVLHQHNAGLCYIGLHVKDIIPIWRHGETRVGLLGGDKERKLFAGRELKRLYRRWLRVRIDEVHSAARQAPVEPIETIRLIENFGLCSALDRHFPYAGYVKL